MLIRGRRFGFTLIELLVVIAIIALLIGILLPALGEARKSGRLTLCLSNMKQFGTATQSYAADYQDRIWSFTINASSAQLLSYADLRAQAGGTDLMAASAQAVDILRRRADREDIQQIDNWIPHVLYNHLVLQDYLAQRLPEKMVVCTEDRVRNLWQTDPRAFDAGAFNPQVPDNQGSNEGKRWPYSTSYESMPASYSPDRGDGPNRSTITQATQHNTYRFTNAALSTGILGRRKLSEVMFPSQKVHIGDSISRHFGKKQFFYAYADARIPLLFFDASVVLKVTGTPQTSAQPPADANEGGDPGNPLFVFPLQFDYVPQAFEPSRGAGNFRATGFWRWTRSGLGGVDFGGKEIRVAN